MKRSQSGYQYSPEYSTANGKIGFRFVCGLDCQTRSIRFSLIGTSSWPNSARRSRRKQAASYEINLGSRPTRDLGGRVFLSHSSLDGTSGRPDFMRVQLESSCWLA